MTIKRTAIIVIAIAALIAAFYAGRVSGIRHAIEDSEIYAVERYDPDHPEENEWNGYDLRIFFDLDGDTHVKGVIQG